MFIAASIYKDTGALVLSVDEEGLRELMRRLSDAEPWSVASEATGEGPTMQPIGTLRVAMNDQDHAMVSATSGAALIDGSADALGELAARLQMFVEHNDLRVAGMHTHIETVGGAGGTLRQGSLPLIIAGPVPDPPTA